MNKPVVELTFHDLSSLSPQRLKELGTWLRGLGTVVEAYPTGWEPKQETYTFYEGSN